MGKLFLRFGYREYVDQHIGILRAELKGIYDSLLERFRGMDIALELKTKEIEKEYDHLNKLRGAVETDRGLLATKEGLDRLQKTFEGFKEDLRLSHQNLVNRVTVIETRFVVWSTAIAAFFILLQFVVKYLEK